MRILVTGSAGHLGEALVRSLREAGHDVVGLDLLDSAYTDVAASVTDRAAVRAAMAGAEAVLHTATLHKPHVTSHAAAGVRGHERDRHAGPAGGGGRRRRRRLRPHQHDERVRPGADPRGGRAGGVDHRGRRPAAPEHLRGHEGGGRGPLRARRPRPRPAVRGPAHVPVLPGAGRRRAGAGGGTPTPTSRSTNCCTGGSTWPTSWARTWPRWQRAPRSGSAGTSSARPRRSRPATWPSCAGTPRPWSSGCFPTTPTSTRELGWRMLPAIDRVYVNARARAELGWAAPV